MEKLMDALKALVLKNTIKIFIRKEKKINFFNGFLYFPWKWSQKLIKIVY